MDENSSNNYETTSPQPLVNDPAIQTASEIPLGKELPLPQTNSDNENGSDSSVHKTMPWNDKEIVLEQVSEGRFQIEFFSLSFHIPFILFFSSIFKRVYSKATYHLRNSRKYCKWRERK